MWAIKIENPGKDSSLKIGTCPIPEVLPNEILIKTAAIGVNRADIFQRNGLYPPPHGASDILGLEISGIVEKIGHDVTNWMPGDKVCALLEGGGYAEYAKVDASQVLHLPKGYNFIEGAALPEAFFTVYSNLFLHANLQKGESLLIHGGASGIGTTAIQIAKAFGIDCYTTAGSDKKCQFLQDLGAKIAINYKTFDFVEAIKSATKNQGVDCIIDMVGGDYFNRNLKILKHGGQMICISFLQGSKIEANIASLVYKNLTIMGTTLRTKKQADKANIAAGLKRDIWPLLENNSIKPIVDSVFSFKEAEKAHKLMEDSSHIGKIILKCD